MKNFPKRGEIYWVNLDPTMGSEIKKTRPAIIISNDIGNQISKRIIVAPITSNTTKVLPFEVAINLLEKNGKVLLDQIRTLDKIRLGKKIDKCNSDTMRLVDEAIKLVLALKSI